VFLGLHGVMVLANLGAGGWWRWAGVGLVLALGLAGLGGRGPAWMVQARALAILVVGIALQATAGGTGGWFAAWPFVLVAVYPLALPGPAGLVVAGLAVLGYVLAVRLAGPPVGPALAVGQGGRGQLDAPTDPTAVLDPRGRIAAVNQAWSRSTAADPAGWRPPPAGWPRCSAARRPCSAAATGLPAVPVPSS
jgi:hypothetical protein